MPYKDAEQRRAYQQEYHRKWYAENHGKKDAANKEWLEANREVRRVYDAAYKRKRYQEQPELRAYALAQWHKRRARKLNQFVEDVNREEVWARDEGICGICQEAADHNDWHLDHIKSLSQGGEHSYANTQVSHPLCNRVKG